jgi:hypothetical protein
MTGVPIAVWILAGLQILHVPNLIRSIDGVDPTKNLKTSQAPQFYRVWTAQASRVQPKKCSGTTFALSTRNRVVRLQIDGEEQLLDDSWQIDHEMRLGDRQEIEFKFIDPVGGELLACRSIRAECRLYRNGLRLVSVRSSCDEVSPGVEPTQNAYLDVLAPHYVTGGMRQVGPQYWIKDGTVTIIVQVKGILTEEWWCPEVEVEWPDTTISRKQYDCDPWDGSQVSERQSWTFSHRLPDGDSTIKVRLLRAGKVFKATRVRVAVK